ncbi:methenyltetrahydrofolate cyclohydrolase FchA (plasmid) [Peptoclostridium acidaminophilum DSM 3953]|uniref:Methenyltetrahydrofolate cyclohydrolase FchA n=1 Tax=Peptoclostridium acidaminophilum DSM 3953 TaxID=1286171 RepID=W8T8T5_PEPAC|nr:cyclodeaminase/cyclohydrolase family protein [Peptoclostridium acidaminophilum]AHM58104.1 methenyltetrahydrofolate cyclohydrolase FchA [Peptoclostridium acidaminophilum DSM 3953]
MLANLTVVDFLEETASNSPVPGGGSIAAVSAAFSAALTQMVANLTLGKKGYEDVQEEAESVAKEAARMKSLFVEYIDKDSDAFNEVMNAFKLPKDTDENIEQRKKAIQDATKLAALVPLDVAREAYKIMALAQVAVEKGNKNAVTDAAVATMMARTAVLSALYNVKINLGSIKDSEFVEKVAKEVDELEKNVKLREEEILSKVVL